MAGKTFRGTILLVGAVSLVQALPRVLYITGQEAVAETELSLQEWAQEVDLWFTRRENGSSASI